MPRSSSHLAIARQWELLKHLPVRSPGITAGELTTYLAGQGYEVTKRTVERDLNELSRIFAIQCNDSSMPYGWHWVNGAEVDFGGIELTDAVSLNLAEQLLKQMLPAPLLRALTPKFEQARKKLAALEAHPMARLPQKVRYVPTTLDMRPPSLKDKIIDTVQEALVKEQQLQVHYASFNAQPKEMLLNPLSLIQRGTVPYLVATAEPYNQPRIFALHRFEKATLNDSKAQIPEDYSVDTYIEEGAMQFGSGKSITLKAQLSQELATYLTETPISEDQKIVYRDNAWKLVATVHDTWQLQFWILSKGPDLTVQSPKSLKTKTHSLLQRAVENYHQ